MKTHTTSYQNLVVRLCCVLVFALLAVPASATDSVAPDFVLKGSDGKNLRLRELRGQVVMLNFWATWCGPCREEMPKLEQIYKQYHKAGLTVLGVNIDDSAESAARTARKLGVSFPVLFDSGKQVSRLYKVDAMPSTVIIDRDGIIRHVHRGYRPGYESQYLTEVRALLKE